jgi:hypothetical protein
MNSVNFYSNYYGHRVQYIKKLHEHIKTIIPNGSIVYLAGDSSLDNKHYTLSSPWVTAINNYESILNPPLMTQDICYHLNSCIINNSNLFNLSNYSVINCAVEEATVGSKKYGLNVQDKFIQNNITPDDILIVSIGGNDLALHPSISTMYNMLKLMWFNSKDYIKRYPSNAWGMQHFVDLFKNETTNYIKQLISKKKPKLVIICSIYYPDKTINNSWADSVLNKLDYNRDPEKLQLIIDHIHNEAISNIKIKNVNIKYFAMSSVLDGSSTNDYVGRVEPSSIGGKKIANGLINIIGS